MYKVWLCLAMTAASASVSHAEVQALNLPESAFHGFPVEPGSMGILQQEYELNTSRQEIRGVRRYGKLATLLRVDLITASIIAVLALAFMVLQCFKTLGSTANSYQTTRRLAEGGTGGGEDPCGVSTGLGPREDSGILFA